MTNKTNKKCVICEKEFVKEFHNQITCSKKCSWKQRDLTKCHTHKREIIEPIGLIIENDEIIIANPCTIPIQFMREVLAQQEEKKLSKGEVEAVFLLKLPKNLTKILKEEKIENDK